MTDHLVTIAVSFAAGALLMLAWDHRDDLAVEWLTILNIRQQDPRALTWLGRMIQKLAGGPR